MPNYPDTYLVDDEGEATLAPPDSLVDAPLGVYNSRSRTISGIAGALARAQGMMKPAERTTANPNFGNKKYAQLSDVIEAARPALAANGLAICQFDTGAKHPEVSIATILSHESGEWMEFHSRINAQQFYSGTDGKPMRFTVQTYHAAMTQLCKIALKSILMISTDETDDDGNSVSDDGQKAQAKQERPAPRKAAPAPVEDPDSLATDAQKKAIGSVCEKRKLPLPDMATMTRQEASDFLLSSQKG